MTALRLFTSESVTEGHPDKICDQISDSILDALITADPHSRVAVETLVTTGLVHVAGEVRTVVFRQIVGVAARRVVTRVGVGDELAAGERIGLMRFGSRMDVFVPPSVQIEVQVGDKTVAGESVIARWPSSSAGGGAA